MRFTPMLKPLNILPLLDKAGAPRQDRQRASLGLASEARRFLGGWFVKAAAAALLLGACACDGVQPAEAKSQAPRPAMFRLSDADSEIYLFGTVHILPPHLVWRTPVFDAAFGKAKTVYFETPGGEESEGRAIALTQTLGMNPPGVRLDSYLNERERKRLQKTAAAAGVQNETLQPMRPWLAAIMLSLSAMIAEGQDPQSGVEKIIEAEANRTGKQLGYFETIDEQLGLFAKLSPKSEKAVLLASFDDIEQGAALTDKLDRAWVSGDLTTLDKYVNGDLRSLDMAVYESILVNRNKSWSKKIDAMMKADQKGAVIFIAVGAGHLAGKDGVPALLQKLGYKIERAQ